MSSRVTGATVVRVLQQLRRDPRTLGLIFVVPPALITLFRYVFEGDVATFNRIGGLMIGIFPFSSMFVVTSIAMLRERTTGTLERLMTMPLAKADILFGYGIAFAGVAALQASITATVAFELLGLHVAGTPLVVVGLAVANAVLGMSLGLLASAFAKTEFQAVQFMPAVVFPQLLLCGLLVPRTHMAHVLDVISYALPLTWSVDALSHAVRGGGNGIIIRDAIVVVGVTLSALALAATTLRRRTP
ncbi:MAG TPA: ABC transporter permease [Gaiellaceae bacterium]|nr:ABC transporter permease [Gaiellaceae bacterium]